MGKHLFKNHPFQNLKTIKPGITTIRLTFLFIDQIRETNQLFGLREFYRWLCILLSC
jgi:hypothetical protein